MTASLPRGLTLRRAVPATAVRFLLALTAAGGGGAARADDTPTVIAPLQVASDQNDINLHDGRTRIAMPVLSVPGAPNLRFDRLQNAAPYLTGKRLTPLGSEQVRRSYAIHTGAESSDAYDCLESECISVTGTGATFNPNLRVYTEAGSGTVWHFSGSALNDTSPTPSYAYYAGTASYANGEVITYFYNTASPGLPFNRTLYRPYRIASSLGYLIKITYADNSDPLSNDWTRVTEAAIYNAADENTPLRRLVYSGATITEYGDTDPNGRSYTCLGCVSAMGVDIETASGSNQLPGEGAPALQVTATSGEGYSTVGAVTRDGVGWSYSYDNRRLQPGTLRYIFDKMTVNGPDGSQRVYDVANSYHSIYDQATNRIHTTITRMTERVSDTVSRQTSYFYDYYDRPYRIVFPELNEVGVVYDEYRNITSRTTTPKPGSGLLAVTESAHYETSTCAPPTTTPLCWRPTWSIDARQHRTDYAYNSQGQVLEQIDPADATGARRRTSTLYTTTGVSRPRAVRVCVDTGATCGTNAPIQTEYDYWGNTLLPAVQRQIDAAQGVTLTTSYTYDSWGRLVSTDGPLAGTDDTTWNRYDRFGRRTWEVGALAPNGLRIATRYSYRDSDDKPMIAETGTITAYNSEALSVFRRNDFVYDSRRNTVRETLSAAGTVYTVTDKSYDDRGNLICTAVRMNLAALPPVPTLPDGACAQSSPGSDGPDQITRNVYDYVGQRIQLRERVGTNDNTAVATWTYNLSGQVTALIDGNGNRAQLSYDGHGRQDRWTFPSITRPTAYNDASQATALASAGSVNAGDYEQYGYDAGGNRISLRKRDGSTLSYQYDNLNRMTVKIVPERSGLTAAQTRDVYYGYDLGDRQLYARFDSATGPGITNTYDAVGLLAATSANTDGVARTLLYSYNPAGGRTRITHPDGIWFDTVRDALNRPYWLNSVVYPAYGCYYSSYRNDGLPAGQSRCNGSSTWSSRDGALRLNGLGHYFNAGGVGDVLWLYAFNPASQMRSVNRDNDSYAWTGHYPVNRTYVTNGRNQYTSAVSALGTANYGYDANGNLTSDGSRTYVYDIENRLVSATPGGTLAYDPLGRLYQITATDGTVTRLLNDADALVAEYNAAGTMTQRYVHWDGADVPIISYAGATLTSPSYLHPDHQGSIVAISGASGMTQINRYDEYGIPAATNSGRFQYTGQAWLAEIGLYYYKARIYSPTLGRFLQTDPVGYQDQYNLYAYVGNDPVNATDPTGERCDSRDGITTCIPEDPSFEQFSFPTPQGWEDFNSSDPYFHSYPVDVAMGQGDAHYGALLEDELNRHPTPGEGAASPGGSLIDVNIPGPWGEDHVMSYSRTDSSGNPFVVNVTQQDHTLNSGFVVRQVVPDGHGGFTLRTYGEGNSWKQSVAPFNNMARPGERSTWVGSARTILEHARLRRANR